MSSVHSETLINPFPGLRPFESHENYLFFGRDGQSNELLRKLRQNRFLAVVGTSGSGKSSLVRAGLLPDLYSGMMAGSNSKWRIAVFRPGGAPMENMAHALEQPGILIADDLDDEDRTMQEQFIRVTLGRSSLGLVEAVRQANIGADENLLLVIDQFEEIFRFVDHSGNRTALDQATAFVKVLLSSIQQKELPIYIVITMRSDYLGDSSRFRDLPEIINKGQYLIPRMTRQQRREAINGPVAVGGAEIAPQLVQRLLNDGGTNPDHLPILQHALMRTWEHWQNTNEHNRALEITDYESIGGIERALSIHADKAYEELAEGLAEEAGQQRQLIAEKMFKFLTEKGTDNREIRRQALLADIVTLTGANQEEVISVIEVFHRPGNSFLMPSRGKLTADSVIDISHESLIRQWDRLHQWVEEEAESSKIFLRLAESAKLHQENKKDHLFGLELQQFLDWKETFNPDMIWAKRYSNNCEICLEYLEESQSLWLERKKQNEARKREHELRRRRELRRTKFFALVLAIATLISVFFLFYATKQKQVALTQRDIAQSNYQISEAQLQSELDPTKALRIAQLATSTNASPLVLNAAHKIYRENIFYKSLYHGEEVYSIIADEESILLGLVTGSLLILDPDGTVKLEFKAHDEAINAIDINRPQNRILTGSSDGTARVWDFEGNPLGKYDLTQSVSSASFAPDGRSILIGAGSTQVWDIDGSLIATLDERSVSNLVFSSDGKQVVTASYDQPALLYDTKGNQLGQLGDESDYIFSVAFSPHGGTIATGSLDGVVKLWSPDGQVIHGFQAHNNRISDIKISPDGQRLLTGSYDNSIKIWDLNGNLIIELKGHQNRISNVNFAMGGKVIISASFDGTAKIWKTKGNLIKRLPSHSAYIFAVDYSPDGSKMATGSYDNTAKIWNSDGELLATLQHEDIVHDVAFSRDGKYLITGSNDRIATLWSSEGDKIRNFRGHNDGVTSLAISQDGTRVLTGSEDQKIRLWDLQGNLLQEFGGHQERISALDFAPDGHTFISASWDQTIKHWDLEGEILKEYQDHTDQIHSLAFSPDGRSFLSGSGDGSAKLRDLQGKIILDLSDLPGIVSSVAISPDGTKILAGVLGHAAYLWDVHGNLLEIYSGQVGAVVFSADSRELLMGVGETPELWETVPDLATYLESSGIDHWQESEMMPGSNQSFSVN